jgi:hypothetical protein
MSRQDVPDETAYRDGEDPLAHHICSINEDNEIKIPKQMIQGIGAENPDEIAVSDQGDFTALYPVYNTDIENRRTLRQDSDGHYLMSIEEGFEAAKPFDHGRHIPILFMSCGEIWLMNHDKLWNKLAHEV